MSKKIFISHSTNDAEIVTAFVDDILVGGLEFKSDEIVCTSSPGMNVTSGEDWRNYLRDSLLAVDAIILVITPNYKSSEICLNEMGAAWASDALVLPTIIQPINYKTVGILAEVKQVEKLDTDEGLDNIYDSLKKVFPDKGTPQARWSTQKLKLNKAIERELNDNPFPEPVSADTIENQKNKIEKLTAVNSTLIVDIEEMQTYTKKLEGKKDAEGIKEAKRDAGMLAIVDEFEELSREANRILKKFSLPMVTFIFNDYTRNNLEVMYAAYNTEIKEAIAYKYIDEERNVLWDETKNMREVQSILDELKEFIEKLMMKIFLMN